MKLFIITGASRGIGAALAEALIDPSHRLICMARSQKALAALLAKATMRGCAIDARAIDLSDTVAASMALEGALAKVDPAACAAVTLINNAGVLEPICSADKYSAVEVMHNVAVNLSAPIALTAAFLRITADWPGIRKVLNISSGAAHSPYSGWSVYCAAKSGLDLFSRCVALEQQERTNGARIVSIAPGVVDTAMQDAIRRTPLEDFSDRPRFVALKESGQLASPDETAKQLLRYLSHPDFGSQPVDDIRNC